MKKQLTTIESKIGNSYVNINDNCKFKGKAIFSYIPTTFKELRKSVVELIKSTKHQIEDTADGFKLKLFNHNKEYVGAIYFCKDKTIWMGNGFELKRTIPQMWNIIRGFVDNEK